MKRDILATVVEEGTKVAGDALRLLITSRATKPKTHPAAVPTAPAPTPPVAFTPSHLDLGKELGYRHECIAKHLGAASVLLREAYERANDEGMGEGTAEKIIEAMNEHSGAEVDIEHMLAIPEAKQVADRLLSGVRQFRKAAWEAGLPRGGGTKKDLEDARLWNAILLKETLEAARKQPGSECIAKM